ncbi:hypothetical protein QEJ31_01840 [Pigmentibacter sp. JX0631]|uniref:hypothetical protein n=1 Tax=Pigmentibacter sp. JX0631 TaxID=2976982 RepID=UPI0024686C3B|nr:hypothetical protein [Pigmentibacter sp. JX0631]WGL60344.1 hypothetical protein QEJ31_01840 [Pigmentibacter sp. JX0631]
MFLLRQRSITLANGQECSTTKEHQPSQTSDLANGERYENGQRVKTLPPSVIKDIEQKNIARRLAGLSPIHVRVRRCLTCGSMFESAGNRTCGCSSRTAGTIAGREII